MAYDEATPLSSLLVGAVARPLSTLSRAADERRMAAGFLAVVVTGLVWAAFSLALAERGHVPSFTGNGIPPEDYYRAQALFVLPVLVVGWGLLSVVGYIVARLLGGGGDLPGTGAAMGLAYGPPILVLFLLPDLLVYAVGGFVELAFLVRLSMPLTALWVLVLATVAARASHGLPWGRAFTAALAAVLVQGAFVGLWVR